MAKQKRVRSPRFSVPNKEQVVVSTETEKLRGTLHLLSLTGGAIRLEKKIASGTLGDVRMDTVSGTFSAAIEFLQMTTSKAQAFRFVAMEPVARERLEDALTKMRGQGLAVEKTPLDQLRTLARRILSGRSRR
jgi:hypothetical protein